MTKGPIQTVGELALEFATAANQPFSLQGAYYRVVEEFDEIKELATEILNDPTGYNTTYNAAFQEKFLKELADCIYTYAYFAYAGSQWLKTLKDELEVNKEKADSYDVIADRAIDLLLSLQPSIEVIFMMADDLDKIVGEGFVLEVIKAVHKSNMTKIGPDGAEFNSEGKILKSSSYIAPDLTEFACDVVSNGEAVSRHFSQVAAAT